MRISIGGRNVALNALRDLLGNNGSIVGYADDAADPASPGVPTDATKLFELNFPGPVLAGSASNGAIAVSIPTPAPAIASGRLKFCRLCDAGGSGHVDVPSYEVAGPGPSVSLGTEVKVTSITLALPVGDPLTPPGP